MYRILCAVECHLFYNHFNYWIASLYQQHLHLSLKWQTYLCLCNIFPCIKILTAFIWEVEQVVFFSLFTLWMWSRKQSHYFMAILVFRVTHLKVGMGEIRRVQGFFLITITTKMWGQLQRELVWFVFFKCGIKESHKPGGIISYISLHNINSFLRSHQTAVHWVCMLMAMAVIKPLKKIPSVNTSVEEHWKQNVYPTPFVSVLFL